MTSDESDVKCKIKNFTTLTKFQVSIAQAFRDIEYYVWKRSISGIHMKICTSCNKKYQRASFEMSILTGEGKNYQMVAAMNLGHIIKRYKTQQGFASKVPTHFKKKIWAMRQHMQINTDFL